MGALEQVSQLRNQGMSDEQIVAQLQQQGVSPKEIQEAISQSNIKSAVTGAPMENQEMQPSITQGDASVPQANAPLTAENPETAQPPQQSAPSQELAPQEPLTQQTQYGEEYYPQQGYEEYSSGYDSQAFVEIAEQAFSEKIKPIELQLSKLNEFMNLTKVKIENIDERLKRIEKHFDKLQIEILEKIGSYGSNIAGIKNEMSMMQNSFSKIVKHRTSSHTSSKK